MKKRRFISLILVLFVCLFCFVPNQVSAKEVLKRGEVTTIDKEVVGSITLYDDYTIVFEYSLVFKNPVVKVCPVSSCDTILPQVDTQQIYLNKEPISFSLSEYVNGYSNEYILIIASGQYKLSSSDSNYPGTVNLRYEINKNTIEDSESSREKELDDSLVKINEVVNKWVIPGIYIVLAIVFIVKLILLCIDVARYSDDSEVRKEKIKGFLYTFIGLLAVGIINASAGFITGLYD